MKLSDFTKKRLSINPYLNQEYPLLDSIDVNFNFEEILSQIKDPDFTKIIDRAIMFERKDFPSSEFCLERFVMIHPKKISVFGNEIKCPPVMILDFGTVECFDCSDKHAKLVAIFEDEAVYLDYVYEKNDIRDATYIHDFWHKPIHHDDYNEPYNPFEEDSESSEIIPNSVEIEEDPKRIGLMKFIGKPWSWSTKITEHDTVKNKIDRAPEELKKFRRNVECIIRTIPYDWSVEAFHFNKGWTYENPENKKRFLVPPFFIFYVGSSTCPTCNGTCLKYVAVFEKETIFINYDIDEAAIFEFHPKLFWSEKKSENLYDCH